MADSLQVQLTSFIDTSNSMKRRRGIGAKYTDLGQWPPNVDVLIAKLPSEVPYAFYQRLIIRSKEMNLSHPASEEIEVSRQDGGKRSNKITFWGSGVCLCVSPSARRREGETESDKEQTGREGSREEAGGGAAARG